MSASDISEEIRTALPGTEELIVQYVADYLVDDAAADDDDSLAVAHAILSSAAQTQLRDGSTGSDAVDKLLAKIEVLLKDVLSARAAASSKPKLTKLDKVVEMGKAGGLSGTLAFNESVDLESVNKGKASRVDVKKLEKQEAKLRAKIDKRSKRSMYEGSKLLDQAKKQQSYEEMFMKVRCSMPPRE
jgi:ATP-binding cassette subfamily F protein 3